MEYVSEVLAQFAYMRFFQAVHDEDGRPLEYIVDLIAACQKAEKDAGGRRDFARERAIVRYIGDYALFMSGLFRERVNSRGELEYYVAHGRSAFCRSADYEPNPARRETYRHLYQEFGPISDILHYLRRVQFPLQSEAGSPNLLAAYWRM